jgi:hypothetical protein
VELCVKVAQNSDGDFERFLQYFDNNSSVMLSYSLLLQWGIYVS